MRPAHPAAAVTLVLVLPSGALAADPWRDTHKPFGVVDPIEHLVEFRDIPAMGFFPMGGDASVEQAQLSTYLFGGSIDTLNFYSTNSKLSLLNASIYLLGVDWTKLSPGEEAYAAKLAYVRFGPHFRAPPFHSPFGARAEIAALGFEVGYGLLLQSRFSDLTTATASGFDVSFTFSVGKYEPPLRDQHEIPRVLVEGLDEDGIHLTWASPRSDAASIRAFRIAWIDGAKASARGCPRQDDQYLEMEPGKNGVLISGVVPGQRYRVRVCAEYADGTVTPGSFASVEPEEWARTKGASGAPPIPVDDAHPGPVSPYRRGPRLGVDFANPIAARLGWRIGKPGSLGSAGLIVGGAGGYDTVVGDFGALGFAGAYGDVALSEKISFGAVAAAGVNYDLFPTAYLDGRFGFRLTPPDAKATGQLRAGVGFETADAIFVPSLGYSVLW